MNPLRVLAAPDEQDARLLFGPRNWPEADFRGIIYNLMQQTLPTPTHKGYLTYWARGHQFIDEFGNDILRLDYGAGGNNTSSFYGNLGINVALPESPLHVVGAGGEVVGGYTSGGWLTRFENAGAAGAKILLVSDDDNFCTLEAGDTDWRYYLGWNMSAHATEPGTFSMNSGPGGYSYYDTSWTLAAHLSNASKLGINPPSEWDVTHGLTIHSHGNASLRIEDAVNAAMVLTSGGTEMGRFAFTGAGNVRISGALGNIEMDAVADIIYQSGVNKDHIWQYDGTSTEAMRVDGTNGNLGIGVAAPEARLHVYANTGDGIKLSRLNNSAYINVEWDDATTPIDTVRIGHFSGGAPFLYTRGGDFVWNNYDGSMKFNNVSADIMLFLTTNTERMRITAAGKVGINCVPLYNLDVTESANAYAPAFRVLTTAGTATPGTSWARMDLVHAASNTNGMLYYDGQDISIRSDTASSKVILDSQSAISLRINHVEKAQLNSSGYFGIGATPTLPLHVELNAAGDVAVIKGASRQPLYFYSDSSNCRIANTDSAGTKEYILFNNASHYLTLGTNNAERLRISSTGKVGINYNNPQRALHVSGSGHSGALMVSGTVTDNAIWQTSANLSQYNYIWSNLNDSVNYGMHINIQGTNKFNFLSDAWAIYEQSTTPGPAAGYGKLWIKDDTANVLMFTDDGGTTVQASQTTGTWSPSFWDNSFSDGEGQTYAVRNGKWHRIGNMVHVFIDLEVSSLGTLTVGDQVSVSLPFTAASSGAWMLTSGYGASLNVTAGNTAIGRVVANTNRCVMQVWSSAAGTGSMTVAQWSLNGRVMLSGWYEVP